MGSQQSSVRPPCKWIWLDFEGGLRGTSVWDASFVDESSNEGCACATRFISFANKRQRAQLRRSLPAKQFDQLACGKAYELQYKQDESNNWQLQSLSLSQLKNVEECVRNFLQPVIENKNSVLCAWNMNGSDKHVLKKLFDCIDCHLVDPLPWFRRHILLPKNTLASGKPGTPRHALKVPSASVGCAHTSLVDTLHMRCCVQRAVAIIDEAVAANKKIVFDNVEKLPTPNLARVALALLGANASEEMIGALYVPPVRVKKQMSACNESWRQWVLDPKLFDANNKLLPQHSKQHKQKIRAWLRSLHHQPPKTAALNACSRRETLERLVADALLK